MRDRGSLSCLFGGLLSLGWIGCSQSPSQAPPPPVPVKVASPLQQEVSQYVLINGRSEATLTFEVQARVEGFLADPRFKEGALVQKGDPLFEIEKQRYQADVDAAVAQLDSAEAQLKSANAQKESANAAHELAAAELGRTEILFEKKVATESEVELKRAQEKVSKAAINDADAAIRVAEAAISRETANKRQAEIQFGYTTISAEFDGLSGEILVDPGNIVGKGENTLLTTVRQIDPLDIYFEVPERVVFKHLRAIYEQRRDENRDVILEVQFEGEEGYPHRGELVLVDNRVDPATGTTLLRGEIPNPYRGKNGETGPDVPFKDRQYLLRPGAYARIRIQTEPIPAAVLVHETAIGTDLSGKYILIVTGEKDEGKVELRRVRLGQRYHGFRQIEAIWKPDESEPDTLTQPIDTNFRYILDGLLRARPGNTVKITENVELTYPEDEPAVAIDKIDNSLTPASDGDENDSPDSSDNGADEQASDSGTSTLETQRSEPQPANSDPRESGPPDNS